MKLKKREITLNEADSLQDVFYLEKTIAEEYRKGSEFSFRKETVNETKGLLEEAEGEQKRAYALWRRSKEAQL